MSIILTILLLVAMLAIVGLINFVIFKLLVDVNAGCTLMIFIHGVVTIAVFMPLIYFYQLININYVTRSPEKTARMFIDSQNDYKGLNGILEKLIVSRLVDPAIRGKGEGDQLVSWLWIRIQNEYDFAENKSNIINSKRVDSVKKVSLTKEKAEFLVTFYYEPARRVTGGTKTTYYIYGEKMLNAKVTLRSVANRWYVTQAE